MYVLYSSVVRKFYGGDKGLFPTIENAYKFDKIGDAMSIAIILDKDLKFKAFKA